MARVAVSEDELYALLDQCTEAEDRGSSAYHGMSYEQGIKAGILWAIGETREHPLEEGEDD